MKTQNLTIEERERMAYMAGDAALAGHLGDIMDKDAEIEALDDRQTLEEWERMNGPAMDYYDFFHECFARLNGHYPSPSVTDDYDKSVVFAAIERGEGTAE